MCGNAADAEDLLQEIFLTAFRKLDQFRGQSALSTWLYRLSSEPREQDATRHGLT